MALPYWYYRGRTTTPIDIPGKGAVVLVPRQKFFAPQSAVSHLLKIKLVRRLPDPPPEERPKEAEEKPLPPPKSAPETTAEDDSSEPESTDAVIPSQPGDAPKDTEGEGSSSKKPTEKEKEQSSRKRRTGQRRQ